jgi:multisubunit Na+/H+ antiporter MnhB subunit
MKKIISLLVFFIFFGFLLYTMYELNDFGNPPSPMDDYITLNAQNESGANNAVTSIVFDYRGYDTLGEATILFTAIAGVMIVLRKDGHHEK